jgi:hypothetical protein
VKAQISIHKATLALTLLWGSCFAMALGELGVLFFAGAVTGPAVPKFLAEISSIYAPYLGAMLVYFFATKAKKEKPPRLNRLAFQVALGASLLWNLVVLCLLFQVLGVLRGSRSDLNLDKALSSARAAGACLSWIASPAIGFFFAKPSAEEK